MGDELDASVTNTGCLPSGITTCTICPSETNTCINECN